MSARSSNDSWIVLRICLFAIAEVGCFFPSEATSQPSSWLPYMGVGLLLYVFISSVVLKSMTSPVPLLGFGMADVVACGLLLLVSDDMRGAPALCLYGFVALAALGRNLLIGMGAGLTAAVMYGILLAAHLATSTAPGRTAGSGVVAMALYFVFGSVGLMVKRVVQHVRQALEADEHGGRDRALDDALHKTRELKQKMDQRELELYDKQRKLAALMSVSRLMSTVRTPDELLQVMITKAREEMNCSIAFAMLLNGDELTLAHSSGISELTKRIMNCRVGEGIFGEVVATGHPVRLGESDAEPRMQALKNSREIIRTLMVVPLQAPQDKRPVGALGVANILVGDRFTEESEDYLKTLATDAAISMKNCHLYQELELSYDEMIQALAQAIDLKDPYTHGHVARVRDNSVRIAQQMKLPLDEVRVIAKGAILHDVGKISTPENILNKPGALSPTERKKMDDHVTSSIHILKNIKSLPMEVFEMVLFHHERFDGKGYPYGLKGDEIPVAAQIISVADAFDAMTSDRPYRKGFPTEKAIELLKQSAGTQFNPRVLQAFFSMIEAEHPAAPPPKQLELKR